MFFVKLIRYIKGYIKFSLTGGFAERFINLCGRNNIPLWDFSTNEIEVLAHTTVKSYKKMRPYAKKTGVKLRIRDRYGLPFILNRYRKRAGISVGLIVCILFIGFMSNFLWNIEVVGNTTIESQAIIDALENNGVKVGTFKRSIDVRQVERKMILDVPKLSWIALNIKGSTATIEIKERTIAPEKIDIENLPSNVIATESGQIKYLEVYDGQPLVKIGDTVLKGDIIVSGITEDKKGNNTLKHARAKVLAHVPMEITSEVDLVQTHKIPTGEVDKKYSVNLFGLNIKSPTFRKPKNSYDINIKSNKMKIFGKELPIVFSTNEYSFYKEETITLTLEQAKEKAMTEIMILEKKNFENATIIEKSAVGGEHNGKFVVTVKYIIEKDIAKLENILTIA